MGSLWNRSGTVERHADDLRARGAQAYFYLGGTTSPLTVYADSGENSAYAHPVVADADGRWPDIFVPYIASYDVRVTTSEGIQLTYSIEIPNPDPVEINIDNIDPENAVLTGMIHCELVNSTKAGYVRLNGRTLGNASSGATERANLDTQALFIYLWNNMINALAPVSGGRGASGAADYAANKTIGLADFRGAVPIGLDDMGSTAGSFYAGLVFTTGAATLPGSLTGSNGVSLSISNMPGHTHTGTTVSAGDHTHTGTATGTSGTDSVAHSHTYSGTTAGQSNTHTHSYSDAQIASTALIGSGASFGSPNVDASRTTGVNSVDHSHTYSGTTSVESNDHTHSISATLSMNTTGAHTHTFTTSSQGGGALVNNLGRSILVTWFIKL